MWYGDYFDHIDHTSTKSMWYGANIDHIDHIDDEIYLITEWTVVWCYCCCMVYRIVAASTTSTESMWHGDHIDDEILNKWTLVCYCIVCRVILLQIKLILLLFSSTRKWHSAGLSKCKWVFCIDFASHSDPEVGNFYWKVSFSSMRHCDCIKAWTGEKQRNTLALWHSCPYQLIHRCEFILIKGHWDQSPHRGWIAMTVLHCCPSSG